LISSLLKVARLFSYAVTTDGAYERSSRALQQILQQIFAAHGGSVAQGAEEFRGLYPRLLQIPCRSSKSSKSHPGASPRTPANSLQKQVNLLFDDHHCGPLTAASAKVAMPAWQATAAFSRLSARVAPEASPSRMPRSSSAGLPILSSSRRWPGSAETCPATQ